MKKVLMIALLAAVLTGSAYAGMELIGYDDPMVYCTLGDIQYKDWHIPLVPCYDAEWSTPGFKEIRIDKEDIEKFEETETEYIFYIKKGDS